MLATVKLKIFVFLFVMQSVRIVIFKTTSLKFECETWPFALWDEHRLTVFDNSVDQRGMK
jgi:hypothetical protein